MLLLLFFHYEVWAMSYACLQYSFCPLLGLRDELTRGTGSISRIHSVCSLDLYPQHRESSCMKYHTTRCGFPYRESCPAGCLCPCSGAVCLPPYGRNRSL